MVREDRIELCNQNKEVCNTGLDKGRLDWTGVDRTQGRRVRDRVGRGRVRRDNAGEDENNNPVENRTAVVVGMRDVGREKQISPVV